MLLAIPEQWFSINSDIFLTLLGFGQELGWWPPPSPPAPLCAAYISAPHLPDVLWMLSHASKSSAFYVSAGFVAGK